MYPASSVADIEIELSISPATAQGRVGVSRFILCQA